MTEPRGLKYRNEEWEALAVKWQRLPQSEREHLRGQMTRPQRKRFERLLAKVHDGKRNFSNQVATRQDVVQMLALYIDRNLVPMARRLDAAESYIAYKRLPIWRRARITVLGWLAAGWDVIERFLGKRGITLRSLGGDDEDNGDHTDTHARGGEVDPARQPSHEDPHEAEEPRLHGDGVLGPDGGDRGGGIGAGQGAGARTGRAEDEAGSKEGSVIEVVSR